MRPGGRQAQIKANILMAREGFFRDVLRILLSEFGKGQEEPSSSIKDRSCIGAMFIIILSAEIC